MTADVDVGGGDRAGAAHSDCTWRFRERRQVAGGDARCSLANCGPGAQPPSPAASPTHHHQCQCRCWPTRGLRCGVSCLARHAAARPGAPADTFKSGGYDDRRATATVTACAAVRGGFRGCLIRAATKRNLNTTSRFRGCLGVRRTLRHQPGQLQPPPVTRGIDLCGSTAITYKSRV